jgi:hypothetical protein
MQRSHLGGRHRSFPLETPLARAKRTTRSEARRRYRADLHERAEVLQAENGEATDAPAGRSAGPSRRGAAEEAPRPGIGYAFRAAFRPLDLRGDLAFLPKLIIHKSVLIPAGITIAATALMFQTASGIDETGGTADGDPLRFIAILLFQYFVVAPPVGAAFLAGFLAPKASWLGGVITGLVAAACLAVLVYSPLFGEVTDDRTREAVLTQALLISPAGGALFASASAWYKRFLNLANPNRGRRGTQRRNTGRAKSRPAQSRRR